MSVLEAPQTWIAAAAVLVVAAVVLIALAPRRRGASTHDAEGARAGSAARLDDDAVTGPVAPAATDDAVTDETASWAGHDTVAEAPAEATATTGAGPAATPGGGVALTAVKRRYVAVPDPARADERAKDRLLAVLLADPAAAVDVVAAMPEAADSSGASGASAAALLRAGLNPAQVAGLCGVDERDLADLVARDLGLLEAARRDTAPDQQGRSHTDEPGRAWASAGSPSSSTTPTTG